MTFMLLERHILQLGKKNALRSGEGKRNRTNKKYKEDFEISFEIEGIGS